MIDIFSKYISIVPIKSKSEGDCLAGMIECIIKQGKNPEIIYTDEEKSFSSKYFNQYFLENKIKHIIDKNIFTFC
jgi:hypothetical protein